MKRRIFLSLAGGLLLRQVVPAVAAPEAEACPVPAELMEVPVKLPHVAERLRRGHKLTIVAIGGASTAGAAAGAPDLAYPHRLQLALAALYPEVAVNVVNKGVPRQLAQQMVERFPSDVLAEEPTLVVWETGTVDAVRDIEIDELAAALQSGIDLVKNRAIDILLVDMQFSRRTSTLINFDRYLQAVHRAGEVNEVYVFPRFAMMRYWSEQKLFNFDEVSDGERARLAAKVYDCIGRKLAEAIQVATK
ncbi:MAG: SGNH/GDSL hydrolase family protein [Thiohalocapsa sp.]